MKTILSECVTLDVGSDKLLTVWLDSPNRSVNVFDADMLAGLESVVEHIASLPERYRAVVFRSRKPSGFFAGADVNAIAEISDKDTASAIVERGQRLMAHVASLPLPTIAAIHGVCMGGGLEFALSCRFRFASDEVSTLLALPEIKLGVIPGWGGTQRLPKLVGAQKALQIILKGAPLTAAKSKRCGLVDEIFSADIWEHSLAQKVERIAAGTYVRPRRRLAMMDRFLDGTALGRRILFRTARKKLAREAEQYPAVKQAIGAIESAFSAHRDGFAVERAAFVELLFSRTAKSLLGLFLQRDRAKRISTWTNVSSESKVEKFERVAIIGAGAMGAGIGALAAMRGCSVVFKEIDAPAADSGRVRVEALLQAQVDRQRLKEADRRAALKRIEFTSDWARLSECDLAIEAVLEVEEVKRDVFQSLDRYLPAHAVLTSNTSSLNVTRMAAATDRMGSVAGLHFFNPVDRMELVEVVRTEACEEHVVQRLLEFVRLLGKTPIVTSDKPGFLVNRVLFPYLGEAVRMVSEGHRPRQVDRELVRFGMPMGPLELIDQVGVDIASHVANSLAEVQPEATAAAQLLANMAGQGWLGKKSNRGFYEYRDGKRLGENSLVIAAHRPSHPSYEFVNDGLSDVQRRLVYPILNEAVHCLDEFVVSDAWVVNLGMVLGTGFAPMHGGPLRLIDSLGVRTVQHNLTGLTQLYGERFKPADGLQRLSRSKGRFFGDLVSESTKEEHSRQPDIEQLRLG